MKSTFFVFCKWYDMSVLDTAQKIIMHKSMLKDFWTLHKTNVMSSRAGGDREFPVFAVWSAVLYVVIQLWELDTADWRSFRLYHNQKQQQELKLWDCQSLTCAGSIFSWSIWVVIQRIHESFMNYKSLKRYNLLSIFHNPLQIQLTK